MYRVSGGVPDSVGRPPFSGQLGVFGDAELLTSPLCEALLGPQQTGLCLDRPETGRLQNVHETWCEARAGSLQAGIINLPKVGPPARQIDDVAWRASTKSDQVDPMRTLRIWIVGSNPAGVGAPGETAAAANQLPRGRPHVAR